MATLLFEMIKKISIKIIISAQQSIPFESTFDTKFRWYIKNTKGKLEEELAKYTILLI